MPGSPLRFAMLMTACLLAGCQAAAPTALLATGGATLIFPRIEAAPPASAGGAVEGAPPPAPGDRVPVAPGEPPAAGAGSPGTTALRGRVLALDDAGEPPIAGATVATSDGREVLTDDAGRFRLEGGWPADGTLVASAAGYMASAVAGLSGGEEVVLHLRAPYQVIGFEPPPAVAPYAVFGRVVDAAGQPVEGALVFLQKENVASSGGLTDATGRFTLSIQAMAQAIADATIVAVRYDGDPAMGFASGLTLRAGETVDFAPGGAADDPLELAPAPHAVEVEVGNAPAGVTPSVSLDLVLPDRTSLTLYGRDDAIRLAALPGARYALRIEAADAAAGIRSEVFREDVAIAFDQPQTRLAETLLTPPAIAEPVTLGASLSWAPVEGAGGYHVQLDSLGNENRYWEAFTPATTLPWIFGAPLPAGAYGLTLTAWDSGGLQPRRVAAIGRRDLRVLPLSGGYRRASRTVRMPL